MSTWGDMRRRAEGELIRKEDENIWKDMFKNLDYVHLYPQMMSAFSSDTLKAEGLEDSFYKVVNEIRSKKKSKRI